MEEEPASGKAFQSKKVNTIQALGKKIKEFAQVTGVQLGSRIKILRRRREDERIEETNNRLIRKHSAKKKAAYLISSNA